MKRQVLLLVTVIGLYLVISLLLQGLYGPSYGFLSGEDSWRPDGQGDWVKHGEPLAPPPDQPSVSVPVLVRYLPVFIPGLILVLFLFTPLRHVMEDKPAEDEIATAEGEPPTEMESEGDAPAEPPRD